MKRCPQCNRVETDDSLVFCRTWLGNAKMPRWFALPSHEMAGSPFLRLVVAENSLLKDVNTRWVVAKAYVDLGQKDKAFEELNQAYEMRLSSLCWLKVEPQLDPLRSDPRFGELLQKMGFPQ